MRVLVYPHDLGFGGSQLNAIELAGAVRDRGHDVILYGRAGALNGRVRDLNLTFVESPEPRVRPTPLVVQDLRNVVQRLKIDVVHGYEWPPILEAWLATTGLSTTPVGTVMSMSVAPFVPRSLPLVVGTAEIAHRERAAGRQRLDVVEPPVDLEHNSPDARVDVAAFQADHHIPSSGLKVVAVSRLAHELKLEGLLCAIDVVPRLGDDVTLVIVGDGPARQAVATAASRANERARRNSVILTGALRDPRSAYQLADVALGMGGSALRAMAFGKPVVVQGEAGFWEALGPDTCDTFMWTGWYGIGADPGEGPNRLRQSLEPLIGDAQLRLERGDFAHDLVRRRFSLVHAARIQEEVYRRAVAHKDTTSFTEWSRVSWEFGRYQVARRISALRGGNPADDFNAQRALSRRQRAPRSRVPL